MVASINAASNTRTVAAAPATKNIAEVKASLNSGLGIDPIKWDELGKILAKYDVTDGKKGSISKADLEAMLKAYDTNKDGKVSRAEMKPFFGEVVKGWARGMAAGQVFDGKDTLTVEDIMGLLRGQRSKIREKLGVELAF